MQKKFTFTPQGSSLKTVLGCWTAISFILTMVWSQSVSAQLTGTLNVPGNYATLALAINDLNTQGVGVGGVTINVVAGNPQSAPNPGYNITTLTGSAANPIVIQGNGNTITAAAAPPVGQAYDAIVNIIGGDYITIQNFTMVENPANTTGGAIGVQQMTEFGVALYAASTTDGAQNNTIQNNTITLSSTTTYQNAIGIFSTTASSSTNGAQSAASIAGTNSNNKFYGNTISGVAHGMYLISPAQTAIVFESGNDIGGTSLATGNTITFGISNVAGDLGFTSYSGSTPAGIYFRNVVGNSARFNTINSVPSLTLVCGGIFTAHGVNPTGVTYTTTISDNIITITNAGITAITGIDFGSGLSTGTIVGSNNTVTINQIASAAVSAAIIGIRANFASATNTLNTNTVTVIQDQSSASTTSAVTGITAAGIGTTVNVVSNTISVRQNAPTGAGSYGSGAITFINVNATSGTINVTGNNLNTSSSTIRSTGTLIGVFQDATVTVLVNIKSNTFNVDRVATSGAASFTTTSGSPSEVADTVSFNSITFTGLAGTSSVTAIASGGGPTSPVVNNKSICNNTISITGTHSGTSIGINSAFTNTGIFRNNSVSINSASNTVTGFSTSSSSAQITGNSFSLTSNALSPTAMTGILASSTAGAHSITNNTFNTLALTGVITSSPVVIGISVSGGTGANVFNNTVTNISVGASLSTGSPIVDGIVVSGGVSVNVFKNKIYGITANASGLTGTVSGIRISGGGTTGNNFFNNLIGNLSSPESANPNAVRGINITSTTGSTNINVFYNTIYLNASSSGANFGTSGIFHTTSATSTTAALHLRNNIIVNLSAAFGTGVTAAYRRSSATLTNYGSASNNNLFFAGTPSATNFIFYDGTTGLQIDPYKTLVSPRDGSSFAETVSATPGVFFQSVTGSDAAFLHIVNGLASQIESGAVNIAPITDDYDGQVRQGNGGYAGTGTAPDVGADEYAGIAIDLSPPSISYTLFPNTACPADRMISATITDGSGVNSSGGTKPRLYFKKSVDANTFAGNTSADNGWKYVEASNTSSPFAFTTNYALLQSPVVGADVIQYFVVAQDLAGTPNVGINLGVFASPPSSVNLMAAQFPITGAINSYTIVAAGLSGTVTIGAAGTYPSLTSATGLFNAINTSGLSDALIVEFLDAAITEDGAISLNAINYNGCVAGPYSLMIRPDAGVTTVLSGTSATALINLNGADNVTIDGSNNGSASKDLTIRNISTAGSTIRFINDATFNTVKNAVVEGAVTSATNGTILFSTSTGTLGNSNNTINNCDIRDRSDAAGVPANAVYSSGTGGALNASNTISGCNIFNWTNSGVLVASAGAGDGWTINPSHFYQTAARTTAMIAISILGGNAHSIVNNSIGGMEPNAGGSFLATSTTFRGISISVGTGTATSVQGNVIKNIRSTLTGSFSASYGIFLQAGRANIGNISGNTVGSSDVNERFEITGDSYGIRVTSTSVVNLSNNTVDNFGTGPGAAEGQWYWAIYVEGSGGAHSIINNTVSNVTNFSEPDATFDTRTSGIWVLSTGIQTIRGNTIHDIGSTSITAPPANNNIVWGLLVAGSGVGTVVENNTIYNLYGSSTAIGAAADLITLLQIEGGANGTYSNNMLSAFDVSGTSDRAYFGILDLTTAPAANNYYFNTVNISGTATDANPTYAFNRNGTGNVMVKSNIFSNTRSGGTGFHVAIANSNAAATGWLATASDYNDLYNSTPAHLAQWLGFAAGNNRDLAGWQAAQGAGTPGSGGDANSISVMPIFVSDTDLHLTPANTSLDNLGTPAGGITMDIDGDLRSGTPDMGADEFGAPPCSTIVMSTGNTGVGTLRDVVSCAAPNSTITFNGGLTGQTITLASEIVINKNLTISGLGMANLTVSGGGVVRMFHVMPGFTLTIEDITLKNGFAVTNGGAIYNQGSLFLEDVLFENNLPYVLTGAGSVDVSGTVNVID